MDADKKLLESILADLENLGIGEDESVDGGDAVDYLVALYSDLREFLKV